MGREIRMKSGEWTDAKNSRFDWYGAHQQNSQNGHPMIPMPRTPIFRAYTTSYFPSIADLLAKACDWPKGVGKAFQCRAC